MAIENFPTAAPMARANEPTEKFNSIKASMYLKNLVTSLRNPATSKAVIALKYTATLNLPIIQYVIPQYNGTGIMVMGNKSQSNFDMK